MESSAPTRGQLTEDDLQAALAERDGCASRQDWLGYARCLMRLERIVKWVRSDNEEPPFVRAHSLSTEALEVFRREGDLAGQIDALCASCRFEAGEQRAAKLEEAQRLAETLGEPVRIAHVLHTRGTTLALVDRHAAAAILRRALELFEAGGSETGTAGCLFSLSITSDEPDPVRREYALRSADLYGSLGYAADAAMSIKVALMCSPEGEELEAQERIARRGLEFAQAAGKRSSEQLFYHRLARIYAGLGDVDKSRQHQRWHDEIERSDGLTDRQRKRQQRRQAKEFAALARAMGHGDAAKAFEDGV